MLRVRLSYVTGMYVMGNYRNLMGYCNSINSIEQFNLTANIFQYELNLYFTTKTHV